MATHQTFQFFCANRISAIETKDKLEEMGFFVEAPCEYVSRQSRHQHKKHRGQVSLIFSIPSEIQDDTPEIHKLEAYADELIFNYRGQASAF